MKIIRTALISFCSIIGTPVLRFYVVCAQEHFIAGRKKLYVLFYDLPNNVTSGSTALFYKGNLSLPVTYRADKNGADLSTLIGRVYQDHYSHF